MILTERPTELTASRFQGLPERVVRSQDREECAAGFECTERLDGTVSLEVKESLENSGGESRADGEQNVQPHRPNEASEYFFDDSFLDPKQAPLIMAPLPPGPTARRVQPPAGLPSFHARLWLVPLLSLEQEQHGFRKLNYLKYRLEAIEFELKRCRGNVEIIAARKQHERELRSIRDRLIESNLRLVVSLAKRYAQQTDQDFDELMASGNAALVHAVDLFDFRRGIRFSTYAYRAIQRSIFGLLRKEKRIRQDFIADGSEATQRATGDAASGAWKELHADEARRNVGALMDHLDDRDRQIVMARFGINRESDGVAFREIAQEVGLSTTRVVQLFNRSLDKLRTLAGESESDPAHSAA